MQLIKIYLIAVTSIIFAICYYSNVKYMLYYCINYAQRLICYKNILVNRHIPFKNSWERLCHKLYQLLLYLKHTILVSKSIL